MKAKVIEQEMADSMLDWTHGFTYRGRRLIVDEHHLVITVDHDRVIAFFGEIGDHDLIGEVEIPADLFSEAMVYASAGERLKGKMLEIVALTGEPSRMPAKFDFDDVTVTSSNMDDNEYTIFESSRSEE